MIEYLVIGHICADLQPDGTTRLGGTALFAALTAHRLGLRAAIVTACADDLDLTSLPSDLPILRQASPQTTLFENRYIGGNRTQLLHARAAAINLSDIPQAWLNAAVVHLAPIMQDVPTELPFAQLFLHALIAATPQGWLRHVQSTKSVITSPTQLHQIPLDGVGIVVLSEEDVQGDEQIVQQLSKRIPIVVLTRAESGATVLLEGAPTHVPALPATVVDPTGAGDVFAAGFLCALLNDDDPVTAARWACATAAWAIEAPGISGLPTRAMVRQRLEQA
jgi:sugar/nucleoside kinase (ribokinase family)